MPARPQHQQTRTGRARRGVVQQHRLTEPGRRLDQHHRTRPTLGSTHHFGDHPPLGIALQQGTPPRHAVPRPGRHRVSVAPIPDRAKTAPNRVAQLYRIPTDLREITSPRRAASQKADQPTSGRCSDLRSASPDRRCRSLTLRMTRVPIGGPGHRPAPRPGDADQGGRQGFADVTKRRTREPPRLR